MGKTELGLKCTCVSCAVRFFDLGRVPAICPKCGAEQPKPKPRFFAPSRPTARSWSGQPSNSQPAPPLDAEAAAPEATENAEDDAVDVEDGVDVIEPDDVQHENEAGGSRDRDE